MPPVVLALGFDLFFKPKMAEAAARAGVELRHAAPKDALALAPSAARVIADASAPGVEEALAVIRAARPELPIVACHPHVETDRAARLKSMGVAAVTRGALVGDLERYLSGP